MEDDRVNSPLADTGLAARRSLWLKSRVDAEQETDFGQSLSAIRKNASGKAEGARRIDAGFSGFHHGGVILDDFGDVQINAQGSGDVEVVGDGDCEGVGAVIIGFWGIGPVSVRRIDGCGSVGGRGGDGEVGSVGQSVRIGGVEVTGGGFVFGQSHDQFAGHLGGIIDRGNGKVDRGVDGSTLVIGDGDLKGIGSEEVGVGGVGPVSVRRIDGCGSVCGSGGNREIGTVGQTVRIGRVEITGGGSVLGDGCLGVPRYAGCIIDRTDGQVDGGGRGCALVIGNGDPKGVGSEEVGVGE